MEVYYIQLNWSQVKSTKLHTTSSRQLKSIIFDDSLIKGTQDTSSKLNSTQFHSTQATSPKVNSTNFNYSHLDSSQVKAIELKSTDLYSLQLKSTEVN